tara:strand:- start:2923 stop:3297 length:375 start_codon:yes stop_codon:yes gene_type:complete
MIIKDIKEKDLILLCNDLLFRTVVELNQSKDEKWFLTMSVSLANDLKLDFEKLTFTDIQYAFRQGVRNTDDFVLSVKTFYKWIKAHRQLIWSEASKEPERQDKRLRYRSGTGMKQISNIKTLKL